MVLRQIEPRVATNDYPLGAPCYKNSLLSNTQIDPRATIYIGPNDANRRPGSSLISNSLGLNSLFRQATGHVVLALACLFVAKASIRNLWTFTFSAMSVPFQ
jgi:hypothetical protein